MGGMLVKSWSSTQASGATSSGEAECNGTVREAAEVLGLKAVIDDLGWGAGWDWERCGTSR